MLDFFRSQSEVKWNSNKLVEIPKGELRFIFSRYKMKSPNFGVSV